MGHSDTKMILRIYDHVTENRAAEQMKKLDSMRSAAVWVYDKFTTNEGIFMRDYADLCQYLNGEDIEINGKIVKTPQNPPCIIVNYVLFLVRNKKVFFRAGWKSPPAVNLRMTG